MTCVPSTRSLPFQRVRRSKKEAGKKLPEKAYIAIDLKSFYASVECMERGLDPMTTNLVGWIP